MKKSCCFFGHRNVFENIEQRLNREVENLITLEGVTSFYMGGMGEFDRMAEKAVRTAKREHPHIKIYLVKPYFSNELNTNKVYYEQCYDDVIVPTELIGVYPKAAIKKRNQWMISQSSFVIAYIRRDFGGAYDAVKFANKNNKAVIEL